MFAPSTHTHCWVVTSFQSKPITELQVCDYQHKYFEFRTENKLPFQLILFNKKQYEILEYLYMIF